MGVSHRLFVNVLNVILLIDGSKCDYIPIWAIVYHFWGQMDWPCGSEDKQT